MYVTNIKYVYDNFTNDCTNNENNIDINIPALFTTSPCVLSFLSLTRLMAYTLNKPLLKLKSFKLFIQVY